MKATVTFKRLLKLHSAMSIMIIPVFIIVVCGLKSLVKLRQIDVTGGSVNADDMFEKTTNQCL